MELHLDGLQGGSPSLKPHPLLRGYNKIKDLDEELLRQAAQIASSPTVLQQINDARQTIDGNYRDLYGFVLSDAKAVEMTQQHNRLVEQLDYVKSTVLLEKLKIRLGDKKIPPLQQNWTVSAQTLIGIEEETFQQLYHDHQDSVTALKKTRERLTSIVETHKHAYSWLKVSYNCFHDAAKRTDTVYKTWSAFETLKEGLWYELGNTTFKGSEKPSVEKKPEYYSSSLEDNIVKTITDNISERLQPTIDKIDRLKRTWSSLQSAFEAPSEQTYHVTAQGIFETLKECLCLENVVQKEIAAHAALEFPEAFAETLKRMGLINIQTLRKCQDEYAQQIQTLQDKFSYLQAYWTSTTLKQETLRLNSEFPKVQPRARKSSDLAESDSSEAVSIEEEASEATRNFSLFETTVQRRLDQNQDILERARALAIELEQLSKNMATAKEDLDATTKALEFFSPYPELAKAELTRKKQTVKALVQKQEQLERDYLQLEPDLTKIATTEKLLSDENNKLDGALLEIGKFTLAEDGVMMRLKDQYQKQTTGFVSVQEEIEKGRKQCRNALKEIEEPYNFFRYKMDNQGADINIHYYNMRWYGGYITYFKNLQQQAIAAMPPSNAPDTVPKLFDGAIDSLNNRLAEIFDGIERDAKQLNADISTAQQDFGALDVDITGSPLPRNTPIQDPNTMLGTLSNQHDRLTDNMLRLSHTHSELTKSLQTKNHPYPPESPHFKTIEQMGLISEAVLKQYFVWYRLRVQNIEKTLATAKAEMEKLGALSVQVKKSYTSLDKAYQKWFKSPTGRYYSPPSSTDDLTQFEGDK